MTQAKLVEMRAIIDFMRACCKNDTCPIMYVMQTNQAKKPAQPCIPAESAHQIATPQHK